MVKREKAAGPEQGDAKVSPEAANKYVEGEGKSTETQTAEPAGHTSGHGHTGGPKELSKGVMGMFGKKKKHGGHHGKISVLHHAHGGPTPRFIIHPNSKYRRTWDMFTVIFVLYLTWIIPFDLAFDWWNMSPGVYVFGYILDAWFAVDILMNFRTGFTHDGHVIMQPSKIAQHYFAFWFWIDIIASIPFEIFMSGVENKSQRKAIKMTKYFKIPRLMRMGRVLKYLRKYAKYSGAFIVIFGFVLSCHFAACTWTMMFDLCGELTIMARGGDANKEEAGGTMPYGSPGAVPALLLDDPRTAGPDYVYEIPQYGICAQERVWDMHVWDSLLVSLQQQQLLSLLALILVL